MIQTITRIIKPVLIADMAVALRETPRGLRYFDVRWAEAHRYNTIEDWMRLRCFLAGAMAALGEVNDDYEDYRTLYDLAGAHLDALLVIKYKELMQ